MLSTQGRVSSAIYEFEASMVLFILINWIPKTERLQNASGSVAMRV